MYEALFSSISVKKRTLVFPPLVTDKKIISSVSAQVRTKLYVPDEDKFIVKSMGYCKTPFVAPGTTPTTLKDLRIHINKTV